MKETRMPPAYAANLVVNSGNTIYRFRVLIRCYKWVSQMQALLAACHELVGDQNTFQEVLYVFLTNNAIYSNLCSIYPHCDSLTYQ